MRMLARRPVAVRHRFLEAHKLVLERFCRVDNFRRGKAHLVHPLGESRAVEDNEIRFLVVADGLGVGHPEDGVLVGGDRTNDLDAVLADAFGEILRRIECGVDDRGTVPGSDGGRVGGRLGLRLGFVGGCLAAACQGRRKTKCSDRSKRVCQSSHISSSFRPGVNPGPYPCFREPCRSAQCRGTGPPTTRLRLPGPSPRPEALRAREPSTQSSGCSLS